jgi:hypothetical protein
MLIEDGAFEEEEPVRIEFSAIYTYFDSVLFMWSLLLYE